MKKTSLSRLGNRGPGMPIECENRGFTRPATPVVKYDKLELRARPVSVDHLLRLIPQHVIKDLCFPTTDFVSRGDLSKAPPQVRLQPLGLARRPHPDLLAAIGGSS